MDTPTYRIEDYIVMKRAWPACYRMYWIGTRNEIFPGMMFQSRKIGLAYYQIHKNEVA